MVLFTPHVKGTDQDLEEKFRETLRNQSIFRIITEHTTKVENGEQKLAFTTRNKLPTVDGALNRICADSRSKITSMTGIRRDAGREHVIRCCILKGIAVFEGYPKTKELIKFLNDKKAEPKTCQEELDLFYENTTHESCLRGIVRHGESAKIPCVENSFQYINSVSPMLKINKAELAYYFFCLGALDADCLEDLIIDQFTKVICAVNKRIYTRKIDIDLFYEKQNLIGNKSEEFFLTCLQN